MLTLAGRILFFSSNSSPSIVSTLVAVFLIDLPIRVLCIITSSSSPSSSSKYTITVSNNDKGKINTSVFVAKPVFENVNFCFPLGMFLISAYPLASVIVLILLDSKIVAPIKPVFVFLFFIDTFKMFCADKVFIWQSATNRNNNFFIKKLCV